MAMPKPRSGRSTSLRELDENRLTESEKIEGASSWDALEWTKIEPVPRSVPDGVLEFLLEAENVIVEETEEEGDEEYDFESDGERALEGYGEKELDT
ncbi:hypothetical protein Acr_23g0000830 [Actinidia rufa]|uniref:Uncharacterized protein n=1 Tax=Actinidia rufa TaxID=165716 RepID=A0A7J0GLT9_9ERIC|nr:hypothetical protein Acr_23g0000830 [Actinidia rufa]